MLENRHILKQRCDSLSCLIKDIQVNFGKQEKRKIVLILCQFPKWLAVQTDVKIAIGRCKLAGEKQLYPGEAWDFVVKLHH